MSMLPAAYRYLADCDDLAADEALAAALDRLEEPYQRHAVEVLLQRAQPAGLLALISSYHKFPADLTDRLAAWAEAIRPVLRVAVRHEDLQTRLNCLSMAAGCGCESLAYLFELALVDTHPRVRELAARTLRDMAARLLREHELLGAESDSAPAAGPPKNVAEAETHPEADSAASLARRRDHLLKAVMLGSARFEVHLRQEVVEPCMWFSPYLGERLWQAIRQPRSRLSRLLADLMVSCPEPATATFVLEAVAVPEMRKQAVRIASERRDAPWCRAMIKAAALWHPWQRVRRSWMSIKKLACLETKRPSAWSSDSADRGLPILVSCSGLPAAEKQTILAELLSNPALRREILWQAGGDVGWGRPLLRKVLQEAADPAEIRMAAHLLLKARCEDLVGDLVKRLATLEGPAAAGLVRLVAGQVFRRLWRSFESLSETDRVASLNVMKRFAALVRTPLRVRLASTRASERLKAARMAGLMGLVDVLWQDMLTAAQDPSSRVRSAAVRFLGASSRPELRDQLRTALEDRDPRVQANAIEAIDEAGWTDRQELLAPKLRSGNNRVRANAIRMLLKIGSEEAREALNSMLDDPRSEHRLTALWTIKSMTLQAWSDRVLDVAERDPSSTVRRYAQSVYAFLAESSPSAATSSVGGEP